MGRAFIVNAPFIFSALWAIIKGFLDERTRSKVRILGSDFLPALLEEMPMESIPSFIGGSCTCSHIEGGCLAQEDVGPWNDYVVVGPNRELKHKSELEEEEKQDDDINGPSD